jgi:uncharacterized phage-like protein YoqJ
MPGSRLDTNINKPPQSNDIAHSTSSPTTQQLNTMDDLSITDSDASYMIYDASLDAELEAIMDKLAKGDKQLRDTKDSFYERHR